MILNNVLKKRRKLCYHSYQFYKSNSFNKNAGSLPRCVISITVREREREREGASELRTDTWSLLTLLSLCLPRGRPSPPPPPLPSLRPSLPSISFPPLSVSFISSLREIPNRCRRAATSAALGSNRRKRKRLLFLRGLGVSVRLDPSSAGKSIILRPKGIYWRGHWIFIQSSELC